MEALKNELRNLEAIANQKCEKTNDTSAQMLKVKILSLKFEIHRFEIQQIQKQKRESRLIGLEQKFLNTLEKFKIL